MRSLLARRRRERDLDAETEMRAFAAFEEDIRSVHESLGAAVALFQARRAGDPTIRRAMRAIAREERSHAALAWAIDAWVAPLLSRDERAHLAGARSHAIAGLTDDARSEPPAELARAAGVPTARETRAIIAEARATIWSGVTSEPDDRSSARG
ncbi:MAG: hypothetical protein EXR72_09675 [Myxococcales bacterium]|nr:hypothetical protein [Myxococcales bacterium]